jgi:hypothetical protein
MTTMNKTELKQAVTKIKKLLKQKDYATIDTGVELARGLGEPAVFEALLGGWSINENGFLKFDVDFSGETLIRKWSDKTWPYYSYAVVSLIGYAPVGTKVHYSIASSEIEKLRVRDAQSVALKWSNLPIALEQFTNLTSLKLSGCYSLQNIDVLASLTQLASLELTHCSALQNVEALANLTNLTSLKLSGCSSLRDVDALANLTQLTSLDLGGCRALQNVDALANLTQLTSLNMSGLFLKNVDALASLTQLTDLNLEREYSSTLKPYTHTQDGLLRLWNACHVRFGLYTTKYRKNVRSSALVVIYAKSAKHANQIQFLERGGTVKDADANFDIAAWGVISPIPGRRLKNLVWTRVEYGETCDGWNYQDWFEHGGAMASEGGRDGATIAHCGPNDLESLSWWNCGG